MKLAVQNGYEVTAVKGYSFSRVENIFNKFINHFYGIKSTTKDSVEKDLVKRILNHLLGKFGQDFTKPVVELMDRDKYNRIIQTHEIHDHIKIGDKHWVKYGTDVSKKICDASLVDYNAAHCYELSTRKYNNKRFKDVSIATASAVTSYARIFMNKTKLMLRDQGINVFYSDTDSLITNKPIPDRLVGYGLGQFKLEHVVKRAYFISNKTYCLVLNDDRETIVIKVKGVTKSKDFATVTELEELKSKALKNDDYTYKLAESDFKKLYYNNEDVRVKRKTTDRNIAGGYTNINDTRLTIAWDTYEKRGKLYDTHGR